MNEAQRSLIHDTVLAKKTPPLVVVECGTWLGGGSTLAAARALGELGHGTLHTWEVDPQRYQSALTSFMEEFPELLPYIRFHYGDFMCDIEWIQCNYHVAILDGPENAAYTELAFKYLQEPAPRTIILHDWETSKCERLRDTTEPTLYIPGYNGIALFEP